MNKNNNRKINISGNRGISLLLKRYWHIIALVVIIAFALYIRLHFFFGTERIDSLKYSQLAYNFGQGIYFNNYLDICIGRLIFHIPNAISYMIFGINEFSSVAWMLFCNLLGIFVVFGIGNFINKYIGLLAALITAFFPIEVAAATRMLPDGLSLLFLGLPIYLFLYAEIVFDKNWKKCLFYFLAGLVWALSYYIKINYVLVFPIFVCIYMIYRRIFNARLLFLLVGFLIIWISASTYFYLNTGIFPLYENQHYFWSSGRSQEFTELGGGIRFSDIKRERKPQLTATEIEDYPAIETNNIFMQLFEKLNKTQATKYLLIASIVSTFTLLVSRRRKEYWIVFILIISGYVYEIATKSLGWGTNIRYLTTLTIPTVVSIATALYNFIENKFLQKKSLLVPYITIIALLIVGLLLSTREVIIEHKQHNRKAGYFYATQQIIKDIELKKWDGNIITPEDKWIRSINMYLGYNNTGYNWSDPNSQNTSRLRDYIHAGARYDKNTKKYRFDDNNKFVLNSIIIKLDNINDIDLSNYEYEAIWEKEFFTKEKVSVIKIINAKK